MTHRPTDRPTTARRYIERAKKIVNNVTINENSDVILVHHLQREISDLKRELERTSMLDAEVAKLRDELEEREKLIQQLVMPWEQRVEQTRQLEATQEASLKNMGVVLSPRDVCVIPSSSFSRFFLPLSRDSFFLFLEIIFSSFSRFFLPLSRDSFFLFLEILSSSFSFACATSVAVFFSSPPVRVAAAAAAVVVVAVAQQTMTIVCKNNNPCY
jgi:hypothetical protein